MTLAILSWLLASVFILCSSLLVHQTLRSDRPALNLMSFVFLTIFTTTAFMMVMGLAGLLRPVPLTLACLAGLVTFLAVPSARRSLARVPAEARSALAALGLWWRGLPVWLRWFTVLAVSVSTLRFAFLVWALPPFVWDSLTYHLTNVAEWTQRGRITLFDTPVTRIYTPANYEVFATWFTVFLHHDVVVEASGVPAYILACLATYAIGRGLGLPPWCAWIGALAYGSTPALLLAATGTKNDPFIAACYLMSLALVLDLSKRREEGQPRNSTGECVLLAACLLYAVGTKTYIVHLAAGLLVVGALGGLQAGEARVWVDLPLRTWKRLIRGDAGFRWVGGLTLAVALFLGSYWYLRNWLVTGNPFYPYGVAAGQHVLVYQSYDTFQLSVGNLLENLKDLLSKLGDKRGPIVPDLPQTTGWGWVAYGLGPPTLIWATVRRPRFRLVAAGFLLSLLALFLSNRVDPWNMRFVIWLPALTSLALATALDHIPEGLAWPRKGLVGLFILGSTLNFAMTLNYNRVSVDQFLSMLERPTRDRQAAYLGLSVPAEYANALLYVPKDELLGYNVHGNGFIYPLYRADFSQRLVYVPFSPDSACADVVMAMESRNTRWLFVAPEHSEDGSIALLRRCSDTGTRIRERARGLYVLRPAQ
jgi:hypothetical protein